jgi:amino acid adenylation domain-containing protein
MESPTQGRPSFNLAQPFFEHAQRDASRLAAHAGGVDISYGEMAALASRIARWLRAGPSRDPGFVGILASRSIPAYAAVLGTCWAGDAYVPLNPKLPPERLATLIEIIRPVALLLDEGGRQALTGRALQVAPSRILTDFGELAPHDPGDRPQQMGPEDRAYMIFTSGSTGVPKGVVVPTRAVDALVTGLQGIYAFTPEDRFSKAYNLSFDGSVHDLFTAWNAGASVNAIPASQLMAPSRFIRDRGLTVWTSVPSTAVFMQQMGMLKPGVFPALRVSMFGGEPLPLRSALAWQEAASHGVVDNLCGHTECCVHSTLYRLSDPPRVHHGLVAIGSPLPGFRGAVWDEACQPVPQGQPGELALSGPQVATGYFGDAEHTAARFPVLDGRKWYRTGDLVFVDDAGVYHHLGRIDNQVKIHGHRIELGEVEAHLAEVCGTDSVACVAWPVENGSARGIVAFHCAGEMPAQSVRDALAERLPHYAVPHRVHRLDRLPLTTNGKIDRRALADLLEQQVRGGPQKNSETGEQSC